MALMDEQFVLHEEALDDLYAWIDGIPFSRPKKNIARDFSDGVLCAEAIAHFMPKIVDMHNYFPASSAMQKKINWSTLNRKVFSKMGIRLSENTIQQLIEAKPGAIEQVLWDIRRKIQLDGNNERQDYRSRRGETSARGGVTEVVRGNRARSNSASYDNETTVLGYRNSVHEQPDFSDEPPLTVIREASRIPLASSYKAPPTAPSAASSYQTAYSNSYQNQGYIAAPAKSTPSSVNNAESTNNNAAIPPSQIIYRGHKMVPLGLLEEREREIKSLEQANKTLVTKGNRFETLVGVKDKRIEDLTHQLHNIRTMYERVTQQTWTGY